MSIGTYCRSVRKRSRNPATATNLRYPVSAICRHQSAEAKRISMYEPRQYLPISAGVDFRIPLRLVFKIRIKGEELPEIAVPPFGRKRSRSKPSESQAARRSNPRMRTASLGGISGAEVRAKTTAASRRGIPRGEKYTQLSRRAAYYQLALDKIGTIPGVQHAAAISFLPLTLYRASKGFRIDGRPSGTTRGTTYGRL